MKKVEDDNLKEAQVVEMETQKITDEELKTLTEMNGDFMNLTMDLGSLEVQIMSLEERKSFLKEAFKEKQKASEEYTSYLRDKYGDINININTGEFVKANSVE